MDQEKKEIIIKGARQNNLKNIDINIPRNKITVITGLSGSGKSSLAFDTIYAEGQRRYVESLSSYARQFLGLMSKPDVDSIDGLSPSISIDQKSSSRNPRSTVGTVTEIYDYLRLLFARIGHPHCPDCGIEICRQSRKEIVDKIYKLESDVSIMILSPVVRGKKGEFCNLMKDLSKKGFLRVRVDGKIADVEKEFDLDKNKKHDIEVIVDRVVVDCDLKERITESVDVALGESDGLVVIEEVKSGKRVMFSQKYCCPKCDLSLPEFSPRMFSFNSPYGACPDCHGLGVKLEVDPDIVIPDKTFSISEGAIVPWGNKAGSFYMQRLRSVAEHYGFSIYTPVEELTSEQMSVILYGSNGDKISFSYKHQNTEGGWNVSTVFEGVIQNLSRLYRETHSEHRRHDIQKFMTTRECEMCRGKRLKKEILAVKINGKSIIDVTDMSIFNARNFFDNLDLSKREMMISDMVLKEIGSRLNFLMNVGLEYLTLGRVAGTLSGGESQRIRLATQIGSNLVGVLYVLDEPSIGLHQRDNLRLIKTLEGMRDLGNTLIVVEHDEETMLHADNLIDIGPGAGVDGGNIVAEGTPEEVMGNRESITGQYLCGVKKIDVAKKRRAHDKWLSIVGAQENNLKNIDVKIPLSVFTCISGVSGSGKSSLVNEVLYNGLLRRVAGLKVACGRHKKIDGIENVDRVVMINQSPIGRTPRSNPATYTGVFTPIRELFAKTKDSRIKGFNPGRFSFNVAHGRCDACNGDGLIKIEMHFLPDIYVPCEVCEGKRYNQETLSVKFKDKNIADVLDMTVSEALDFFMAVPRIKRIFETLVDVGLGYIKLGQSATTLSGGEAQRIKLAAELAKRSTGKTVYLLDEPTTGLHFEDIKKLLKVLNRLVDKGNSVVVIEHNMDVIKCADHIIDLGPEGGDAGGSIVAEGTPEEVSEAKGSYTGKFLKKILAK